MFLNEFAFDVSHCHLCILVKTEQHIGIGYTLCAASFRTLCGDSDFVIRSHQGHRHDISWIVVRLASTAKSPWAKLAANWWYLGRDWFPLPEYAGLAFQPLTGFWGGGSYTCIFFFTYAKMPTTYASHLETENKSHS